MRSLPLLPLMLCLLSTFAGSPSQSDDQINLRYSRPEDPGLVSLELTRGSIHVEGTDDDQIRIEAKARDSRSSWRSSAPAQSGLPRVGGPATGIRVSETNNRVYIQVPNPVADLAIKLYVPRRTSLSLSLIHGEGITVVGVTGEVEVTCEKGAIQLSEISGNVIAHSLNDKITVSFARVAPKKVMSFTTMNGDIDVSLPDTIDADLRLITYQGQIFSDLSANFATRSTQVEDDRRASGGSFQVEYEQALHGKLGKGGAEFLFKSVQGNIYVRKANL